MEKKTFEDPQQASISKIGINLIKMKITNFEQP